MYRYGLGAVFSAKRAAGTAYRAYAVLSGLGTLTQTPKDTLQSLYYRDTLPLLTSGEFLKFRHSVIKGEKKMQAEKSRSLWNLIVNVRNKYLDKSDQDAETRQYDSTQKMIRQYLERNEKGVCAARAPAGMDVWPG